MYMDNIDLVKQVLGQHNIIADALTPLTGGQVNLIYKVDNKFILRIGRDSDSALRLKHETETFEALKGRVPIPEIVYFGEYEGSTYQIQKFIDGELLTRIWTTIKPTQKEDLVKEMISYLKNLHQIYFSDFGLQYSNKNYGCWADYWEDKIDRIKTRLHKIETYLPEDLLDLVFEYFNKNKRLLENDGAVFVHGDFWPGNILVHKGRVSGFLDFEFAIQAPKEYELLSLETFCLYPNDYEEQERFTTADFADLAILVKKYYPEIFETQNLRKKLDLYQMIKAIDSHVSYLERHSLTPKKYYPVNPIAKITNFLYEEGARVF